MNESIFNKNKVRGDDNQKMVLNEHISKISNDINDNIEK